jgi:hypothetical protein
MQDQYKALMFRSFKDAMDVVADYNEWAEDAFEQQVPVPPQAVPQVAMALYRSRVMAHGSGEEFSLPEFDGRMYE